MPNPEMYSGAVEIAALADIPHLVEAGEFVEMVPIEQLNTLTRRTYGEPTPLSKGFATNGVLVIMPGQRCRGCFRRLGLRAGRGIGRVEGILLLLKRIRISDERFGDHSSGECPISEHG